MKFIVANESIAVEIFVERKEKPAKEKKQKDKTGKKIRNIFVSLIYKKEYYHFTSLSNYNIFLSFGM